MNNHTTSDAVVPMDVDPIDDGPSVKAAPVSATLPDNYNHNAPLVQDTIDAATAAQYMGYLMNNNSETNDLSQKILAANHLDQISQQLGPERTQSELVPFVLSSMDEDDEVLLAFAKTLSKLQLQQWKVVLQPLELLLCLEEPTVRDAAVASALDILPKLEQQQQQQQSTVQQLWDMVHRLGKSEWFTGRISSVRLLPHVVLQGNDKNAIALFLELCRDETPMVRRVAAQQLGTMLERSMEHCSDNSIEALQEFMKLYQNFASMDQPDSVRLQTTQNCVSFGKVLQKYQPLQPPHLELLHQVLPLITSTIDDRSWRVRWTAAAKFADVCVQYDSLPNTMDALIPAFEKLLQDPEAEVRTAATFNLAKVAQCHSRVSVSPSSSLNNELMEENSSTKVPIAERLVKKVTSLTEDDSEHVRAALAMVATELAPVLGKELTITYLVPPVLLLLRDAVSEVRLNLISSLSALNEVIGVDLLSQSLLPAILDLAQDGKWRIRLAIIQHIPLLGKQLGREFFTEKLSRLCVSWLGDDIATIRLAAAANLKELTQLFGTQWATQHLLKPVFEIREHKSYLRRLTALKAICLMSSVFSPEALVKEILPVILDMCTDVVPNIRFNVAKELEEMSIRCGKAVFESQIQPVLSILLEDEDRDVRHFTTQTMQHLESHFGSS